jgi:hypothetical protein
MVIVVSSKKTKYLAIIDIKGFDHEVDAPGRIKLQNNP